MNSPIKAWRKAKNNCLYLGKKGRVISCTLVNYPPKDYIQWAPYWTGVIELNSGKRVVSQLVVSNKQPKEGDWVIGVFRQLKPPLKAEIIEYGVKFKIIK
ncbi:OB-fold domain-containing protein [Patescibacteria group bacterium]|nr:OB-fold domain-containing protein [Patescibacteria group bacterium]MBU1931794.1 OB-fold domain-containing protein [Patescibacteria group bacterium]